MKKHFEAIGRQDLTDVTDRRTGKLASLQKLTYGSVVTLAALLGQGCNRGEATKDAEVLELDSSRNFSEEVVAARRQWRARLAGRAVEVAGECDYFSDAQKKAFRDKLAASSNENDHMQLLEEIEKTAFDFRLKWEGILENSIEKKETHISVLKAASAKVPRVGELIRLRSAGAGFDHIGKFGMTLELAIKRCERAIAGEP